MKLICDVCNEREAIGVASSPFLPISHAYCRECLDTNAQPFGDVVFIMADVGGDINNLYAGFGLIIEDTLKMAKRTRHDLDEAVRENIELLRNPH